jgi:hypothetical protein
MSRGCYSRSAESIFDLPRQNPQEPTRLAAEATLEADIRRVGIFVDHEKRDRHDYGTDYQLEIVDGGARTNVRVHVQLKGTNAAANKDGSLSVAVTRPNLNYLLSPADSIYVCHHIPTGRTLVRGADELNAFYERSGSPWQDQQTITVRFSEPFDDGFQKRWHGLALARSRGAAASRTCVDRDSA